MIDSLGYLLPDPFDSVVVTLSLLAHFTPFATGAVFLSDLGFFLEHDPSRAVPERPGAGAAVARVDRVDGDQRALVRGLAVRIVVLFSARRSGCRVQTRLPRLPALAYAARWSWRPRWASAGLANVALALHDVHVDLTRERGLHPLAAGRGRGAAP